MLNIGFIENVYKLRNRGEGAKIKLFCKKKHKILERSRFPMASSSSQNSPLRVWLLVIALAANFQSWIYAAVEL